MEAARNSSALDPASCVAITIDMQREYLDVAVGHKTMPAERAETLVANTARFLTACRGLQVPVVHCYVTRSAAEIALGKDPERFQARQVGGSDGPDRLEGTAAAEVPAALVSAEDLHVRTKKTMDSFFGTELDYLLGRILRRPVLLLAGINTETCVYSATFGASVRGYRPVVIRDCVGTRRSEALGEMALDLMSQTVAWVVTADDVVAALRESAAA